MSDDDAILRRNRLSRAGWIYCAHSPTRWRLTLLSVQKPVPSSFDDPPDDDWPMPSPEAIARAAAAPEGNAQLYFFLFMLVVAACAIALPAWFMRARLPAPVDVEGSGYYMQYDAALQGGLRGKRQPVSLYIGMGRDGQCHVGNAPPAWDTGLCATRLRQIEANDCKAAPEIDDAHCASMLPGPANPQAVRRPARIIFHIAQGRGATADELR